MQQSIGAIVEFGSDHPLVAMARDAAAAHPRIALSLEVFLAHLAERAGDGAKLNVADLYLACACLHRDPEAWRILDQTHLVNLPAFIARIDRTPEFADEVRQRLSEKLLYPREDGGAPKLALYTGRGPLGGWLRVVAAREAQNMKRGRRRRGEAEISDRASPNQDPEIELLKRTCTSEFESSLHAVLAGLSPDERNVIRLHYLDGLSLEDVGKVYRVSRATAARWIAAARENIVARLEGVLGAKLARRGVSGDSILAFVRSQLDVSFRRHLCDGSQL